MAAATGGKHRCSSTASTRHEPAGSRVPEIFPLLSARSTVDLLTPQAAAASESVYDMMHPAAKAGACIMAAPWLTNH